MPKVSFRNLPEEIHEEIDEVWCDLAKKIEQENIEKFLDEAQNNWIFRVQEIISFRNSMQEYNKKIDDAFCADVNLPIKNHHFRLYVSNRELTDSYLKRGLTPF